MTKISRIKLDPTRLNFFLSNFWNVITLLENRDDVKSFLKALLSHTEMKMLAKRIQIAKMLLEGHKYQEIKGYVKVTDNTISKINNILASEGEGLITAVKHLQKIEKQIENERMNGLSLEKRYPSYFLPEIIAEEIGKKVKARSKKKSVKNSLTAP